jgi:hypothetical protein
MARAQRRQLKIARRLDPSITTFGDIPEKPRGSLGGLVLIRTVPKRQVGVGIWPAPCTCCCARQCDSGTMVRILIGNCP